MVNQVPDERPSSLEYATGPLNLENVTQEENHERHG